MSRALKVLVIGVLLVLLLPGTAAAAQNHEAQPLIDEATAVSQEMVALNAQITDGWTKVGAIDPAGKNAADALPLLTRLKADYATMTEEARSMAALMDETAALDVSEELKTFAGLEKAMAQSWMQYATFETDVIGKLEILFDPGRMAKLSQADVKKLSGELNDLGPQETELLSQISEKQLAAQQYYTEHGLDQPSAANALSGGVFLAAGIGGLVFAVVFAVVCGVLARRKHRSVAGWAILGFFFPVIALVLILVLSEKKPQQSTIATPPSEVPPPMAPHPAG